MDVDVSMLIARVGVAFFGVCLQVAMCLSMNGALALGVGCIVGCLDHDIGCLVKNDDGSGNNNGG
mgnify:CR=1 FL=1